jgi:hypothetical protein
MIGKAVSGLVHKIVTSVILIILGYLLAYSANAQESDRLPNKYLEFHIGAQSHFGQTENQAEISGGHDTISFDNMNHFYPGFKSSVPVEIAIAFRCPGRLKIVGCLGYFYHDLGLVKTLGQEEYHFARLGSVSINTSAQLYLGNYIEKIPFGFYCGFSAGCIYPITVSMDKQVEHLFGVDKIISKPQFHLGLEGVWNARLTKSGLYLTLKVATDLPLPLIGSLGKIKMNDDAEYTYNNKGIKMYSIGISGGIGYILSR